MSIDAVHPTIRQRYLLVEVQCLLVPAANTIHNSFLEWEIKCSPPMQLDLIPCHFRIEGNPATSPWQWLTGQRPADLPLEKEDESAAWFKCQREKQTHEPSPITSGRPLNNITIYAVVTSSASAFSASSSLGWGKILTIILTKFRILCLRRFLRRTVPGNDVISTTCIAVLWWEGVLHYPTAAITTMQSYECGINQSMIIRHCLWHRRHSIVDLR